MQNRVTVRGAEAVYLLEYEKNKIRTCADSLQNLAVVFRTTSEAETEKDSSDRQNTLWKQRLRENRELLSDNLKEMARIMHQVAEEKVSIIRLGERKEKQMSKMLQGEGLVLEDFYLLEVGNGKRQAVAALREGGFRKSGKLCTAEDVAGYLSVLLNIKLVPMEYSPFFVTEEKQTIYFEEENKYNILSGIARAVKETEKVSGDNYSFWETGDGSFHIILSDGMGSGEKAYGDSAVVVEMAESFLEAGFSKELTAQMINDVLIAGGEEKNMSTLDLCSIDLHNGECEFIKVGAACTFLKRDSYVEKIPSTSLPLGVFHPLEVDRQTRTLMDGDYLFLCSDGIVDAVAKEEGEEFLKEFLAGIPYQRPTEMANYIMKYAIQVNQGRIRDDMTVLVIGFWENPGND